MGSDADEVYIWAIPTAERPRPPFPGRADPTFGRAEPTPDIDPLSFYRSAM